MLDGPGPFGKLKLGPCKVAANYGGQTQEKRTTIHKGDLHELVFFFDEQATPAGQEPRR